MNNFKKRQIIEDILAQYPEGIENLIATQDPSNSKEPYCILILNSTEKLYNKYYEENPSAVEKNEEDNRLIQLNDAINLKYESKLIRVFECFDSEPDFIDSLMEQYKAKNNKSILSLEDFIFLFCLIIKHMTNFNISLSFLDSKKYVLLRIYGKDELFDELAENFGYQLQMNPFGYYYEKNLKEDLNFEEYDCLNLLSYSPYYFFDKKLKSIFRKYSQTDEFVENESETIFRSLDKLRLINYRIDEIIKFSYLYQEKIGHGVIFKRNEALFLNNSSNGFIQPNTFEIFNRKKVEKRINFIRNYFNEEVAFYFLWLDHLVKWIILPTFIGILLFLVENPSTFILVTYSFLISSWSILLFKTWKQKENFYICYWNTQPSKKQEQINERFRYQKKERLVFGYFDLVDNKFTHNLKQVVSFIVLFLMILKLELLVYLMFYLKKFLFLTFPDFSLYSSVFVGVLNGIQMVIMHYLFYVVSYYLTRWENHKTLKAKNNSMAIKTLIFNIFNYYSSLIYIGFFKKNFEGCLHNNCLLEIRTCIYPVFGSLFFFYLLDIVILLFKIKANEKKYNLKSNDAKNRDSFICLVKLKDMYTNHNNVVLLLGYFFLFNVSTPLMGVFIFGLIFTSRLIGHFKFYHLHRVEFVSVSQGIEIYNYIVFIFIFAGSLCNFCLVLVNSTEFSGYKSAFILGILENLLIPYFWIVNWNILPQWFFNIDLIKELYIKKYVLGGKNTYSKEEKKE